MNHTRLYRLVTKISSRQIASSSSQHSSYKFLVLGGGPGGLSIASYLARKFPNQVAVVEPAENHYYQPMWTLVGAGLKTLEQTSKPMADVIPPQSTWIKKRVAQVLPDETMVLTSDDEKIKYDVLVVALGLKLEFEKIPGLTEALGTEGVGCNYSVNTVLDTYKAMQNFKGGNALFTLPSTPVKCPGAPQKIMYLAEEIFCQNDVRDKTKIAYKTPGGFLFAVEKYRNSLVEVCRNRDIQVDLFRNLIKIDALKKEATFEFVDDESSPRKTETIKYDFIHVTPPMGPVEALKTSRISDAAGFVEVDRDTLQHVRYSNIFSLGDCANIATSKTAAAVAAESGVVRQNLISYLNGKELKAKYNGYTSCPLITSHNTCILAEFDYTVQPRETFPIDQGKERRSMYWMKADVMPEIYWRLLLTGRWAGPEKYRKAMHLGIV